MSLSPVSAGIFRRALGATSALAMALLAGCGSPSDPTEENIAAGVELALAERDPMCRVTLVDDVLPDALKAKHPKGEDGFPAYWVGQDQAELKQRIVGQMPDRSGPSRGRLYLDDLAAGGVATISYAREVVPDQGAVMIATVTPTDKLKGWKKTNRGYPVICHGKSKLAGVDRFTTPVDTPAGKMVRVDYRWELDEAASWVIAGGGEKALRDSLPEGGVPARITLVATNKGWQPARRR